MNTFKNTLFILVFSLASFVQGQVAPVDDHGLAIGGYDVVAYFSGTPQKGHKEYATKHKGVTYYFSSKANWKAFKKSPKSYLPQFDGYCAWGVGAKEAKFPINPETFDIVDGKLYLFFNGPFDGEPFNSIILWNEDTTNLINASHAKWDKVRKS